MAANEGEGWGFYFDSDDEDDKQSAQNTLRAMNKCAQAYENALEMLMLTDLHEVKRQKALFELLEVLQVAFNDHVRKLRSWIEKMQGLEDLLGGDASMEEKREIKATAARLTESFNRKAKEYRDKVEDERKKHEAQVRWIDASVDRMVFQLSVVDKKASAKKEE